MTRALVSPDDKHLSCNLRFHPSTRPQPFGALLTLRELTTAVVLFSFAASSTFAQSAAAPSEQKIEQDFLAVPSAKLAGEHLKR